MIVEVVRASRPEALPALPVDHLPLANLPSGGGKSLTGASNNEATEQDA